jgi:endonuclease/exonuclease/phosphatase family metal-dependent hydrolase
MFRWLRPLVLAALTCHLIGCGGASDRVSTSGGDPGARITVVTLNLYHDKDAWPERRPAIVAALRELRPDVIALQEVIGNPTVRNQAEDLAEELGYECTFSSVDPVGGPKRYGNAILTRHPLVRRGWVRLRPLDDSRTAAHARISFDGGPVNVYVTHLHHTAEGASLRAQQVADLLAFVRETDGGAPSIIAGDLNAEATSPELGALARGFASSYDVLHPEAVREAQAHATLNPHYFPVGHRRIDHIFVERGRFAPLESRIILDRADAAGRWPSDHFGLMTRARILPR